MPGLVSFVSLGPGDPALLTARASARLAAADVVVREGDAVSAEGLVQMAREGTHVVRATPGDALSSVQVLEEVVAVSAAGVPFEVVPGVGARSAAAAFAGIVGRATRVSTAAVERELLAEPDDAVVSLIVAAGEPRQRVVVTTVAEAPARARELGETSLIVAIGRPAESLLWFERRPLFGKRVLVTRAKEQAGSAATLLREAGAAPLLVPTIEIGAPDDPRPLARALAALRERGYAWAAFTSANGVERTWEALAAAGGDARAFGGTRLAAIGPATAAALERHGLRPDVVAREFKGEGLAEDMLRAMAEAPGDRPKRVLLARAARARDVLPEALRASGWGVDVVAAYATRPPPASTGEELSVELLAGRIDAVLFTSSSTVDNLCDLLGPSAAALLSRVRVASIGPVTTQTALGRGVRVDVTAGEYTVPGLIQALAASYG